MSLYFASDFAELELELGFLVEIKRSFPRPPASGRKVTLGLYVDE